MKYECDTQENGLFHLGQLNISWVQFVQLWASIQPDL